MINNEEFQRLDHDINEKLKKTKKRVINLANKPKTGVIGQAPKRIRNTSNSNKPIDGTTSGIIQ